MRGAVRKFGNSTGIIIPKPLLAAFGATAGDNVSLTMEAGRIVIERLDADPRAGWAEDAAGLAESGDDGLVWPELANEGDQDLTW
jgi:antitoxin MazE